MEVVSTDVTTPSTQLNSSSASTSQELECSSIHQLSGSASSDPALHNEGSTALQILTEEETNAIVENLFSSAQIDKMHHFHKCRNMGCNGISKEEMDRVKMTKKKDRFQHEWLFRRETCFCPQTGIWWLVYVDNEGMYCSLCRKHKSKSAQNRSETFSSDPSTRFKWSTVKEHMTCAKHQTTVKNELLNRVSLFQKQVDEKESSKLVVLQEAFHAVYWLAKESIANRKITSLLQLMELLGLEELKYFTHRSRGSLREIFLTIGNTVREHICGKLQEQSFYGLLVDDMADVSNEEQMLGFVQFFDVDQGKLECKFLFTANVLEESASADATTLHGVITKQLQVLNIPLKNLRGLATDGASVMTGKNRGLAALLKKDVISLVAVHCVCHRLALACTDTNDELAVIKEVETEVTQLWKIFDNSPKKLAAYLKVQEEMKQLTLGAKANKRIGKRLKKACKTRWLSFDNAIAAVRSDLPSILQTLRQLKTDPSCYGLLKKLMKVKKIGIIYILHEVLPVLSDLSRVFQQGTINFAHIKPSITVCKEKLAALVESKSPIKKLQDDLAEGGTLAVTEIKFSSKDIEYLENLLKNYVNGLVRNITKRFKDATPVLTAIQVFDKTAIPPKESDDFMDYGKEHIDVLASHYFPGDEVSQTQLQAEWKLIKYDLLTWKLPQTVRDGKLSCAEWVMQQLVKQKFSYRGHFPLMISVVEALLVIPVSNAWPERGASKVKLIKNRLRSLLKGDMLNSLMHISLNGPSATSEEGQQVIKDNVVSWLAAKNRKKLPSVHPSLSTATGPSTSTQPKPAESSTCTQGTQTVVEELTEQLSVDDEVTLAAEKLGLPLDNELGDHESDESDYYSDLEDD